ncbi:MAG: LysM peptidoglycan-binding domain-containing protein [Sphingomonadaceae bacterium]|jgi:hypothetical protein
MTSAYIADGKPRSVSFTLDEIGQIIRRDESGYISGQTGNPHEVWYRFSGRQMGYTGNNGTSDLSYDASVGDRRVVGPNSPGTFRNSQVYGGAYADFAQNYDPINSYYQGAAGGSYRVNQGDSLQGIAQSLYGDSSLWYKIAEANGLSAAAALVEGQTLVLPTGVLNAKNNAGTFKPYNAGEAIGDLSPSTPQPPKNAKNNCGAFGMILLAVIAIAVTAITAGAATAALGPVLGGAASAAAGSIVSQAAGVATGIQDKFSWKAVGLAAIGGAVGGGLKELGRLGDVGKLGSLSKVGSFIGGSGFASTVTRAVLSSAVTQGIGVATGLQDKFSWAGVAAAGVGAAVGYGAGELFGATSLSADNSVGNHVANLATNAARLIANAATRSAIDGTSFGDNIRAALPDILGQAIGDILLNGLSIPERQVEQSPVVPSEWALNTVTSWNRTDDSELINQGALVVDRIALSAENSGISSDVVTSALIEPEFQADILTVAGGSLNQSGDTEVRGASARIVRRVAGERAAQVASEAIAYIPPPPPEIIVWGERSRPLGTAPNFLRWAAGFLSGTGRAVEYVDRKIREEVPFAEFALEAISFAAGPASYAAGKIIMASPLGNQIERAAGRIASWAAGRLRGAGIDPAEAAYAASGAIFLGGLAFGARRALDLTRDIRYALGLGGRRSVVVVDGAGMFPRGAAPALQKVPNLRTGVGYDAGASGTVNTRAFVVHGNSASSPRTAYLYELYQTDGTFLKNGITQNMDTRYTRGYMKDKFMREVTSGPRSDLLLLERQRTIANPGPLNREPWAVKARGGQ